MSDVGVILENFLCVRRKGKVRPLKSSHSFRKWKHSLKLFIWNTDKSFCYTQDAVNAYLWFLDPNHQGTLMLVCDYKVRCISFDNFEELNKWVEMLKTFLACNYFHADLVLASKESKLHSHARRRRRQLHSIASQKRAHSLAGNTNATGMFRTSAVTASGDGYLHVTRDRICFTTGPGCARPRLLATWSFDNDDLVQCGTARGKHVDDLDDSDDTNRASLFFLTASPNHTEAPGSHLFISGRAAELCEWIEANNKGAVYQAEWRQFTSLAAVKDQPFSSPLPNQSFLVEPLGVPGVSNPDSYSTLLCSTALSGHPFQTCCQCGLPSELEKENERNERNSELDAPYRLCHRTQDNRDFHHQFSTESA
ncbi:uncharacterized protein DEA37_0011141 [Paragonimus westermani]|uniref:PH domain-containing protein n=1 Tax=Paragonimus westermani TaxID=34504 RepID=A0A5J4N8H5_9TREM|nr:uncharacterized protein DEA37_0011141 [Paragonimus westermani]